MHMFVHLFVKLITSGLSSVQVNKPWCNYFIPIHQRKPPWYEHFITESTVKPVHAKRIPKIGFQDRLSCRSEVLQNAL